MPRPKFHVEMAAKISRAALAVEEAGDWDEEVARTIIRTDVLLLTVLRKAGFIEEEVALFAFMIRNCWPQMLGWRNAVNRGEFQKEPEHVDIRV